LSELEKIARQVEIVGGGAAETLDAISKVRPDIVVISPDLDRGEGLRILKLIKEQAVHLPVLVLVDEVDEECASEFRRLGALECIECRCLGEALEDISSVVARWSADRERYFCEACPPDVAVVGKSAAIVESLRRLKLVAKSRCNPVLILGETGTGKELAARCVHVWREGTEAPFLAINCAALNANLLESELFGHVKGAFTGADRDKSGLFELAGKGSIFLDEISEMPMELQAKLLRVLQEKTFRKVGGTKSIVCEATIIASSNRNLFQEAKAGRFRQDLYYRLAVFPIELQPLRSPGRRSDIRLLARYFVENAEVAGEAGRPRLSKAAEDRLMQHAWPGNIRELRNVIERAIILAGGSEITPEHLLIETDHDQRLEPASSGSPEDFSLERAEKEFIMRALRETGGQKTRAAGLLGITRATLHAKLKRYGIELSNLKSSEPGGERLANPTEVCN